MFLSVYYNAPFSIIDELKLDQVGKVQVAS